MSTNKMREALEFIAAWDSFPRVANADGTTTSYGVAYGSNGQRDYMRNIASKALADDDIERGTMRGEFEAWWAEEGYKFIMANVFTKDAAWGGAQWQASRAAASQSVEPYGCVTTQTHTGQQVFYRWPRPPYLDNASECVTVYRAPPSTPTDAEYVEEGMRLHELVKHNTLAADNFSRGDEKYLAHLGHARIGTEALRAHLSTRPQQAEEWIACSERLPVGPAIVAAEFDGPGDWRVKIGDFYDGAWHVYGASWTPTRWRPLPAPPNKTTARNGV